MRWAYLLSFIKNIRVFSSVGLEHYLDKVGVTGSSPVIPTGDRRDQGSRETGKQRCRDAERQGCRDAGRQGSREAGRQGCRESGMQGCRDAGRQGCREAGMQGCRETGMQGSRETVEVKLRPSCFAVSLVLFLFFFSCFAGTVPLLFAVSLVLFHFFSLSR